MKYCWVGCLLLSVAILFVGCASTQVAENAAQLEVQYQWTAENKCSQVSPEVAVSGVPADTAMLMVTLKDLDAPAYGHGGGLIKYDGQKVIPKGALRSAYTGPCPGGSLPHTYSIAVEAMDKEGTVVGMGEQEKPCCDF